MFHVSVQRTWGSRRQSTVDFRLLASASPPGPSASPTPPRRGPGAVRSLPRGLRGLGNPRPRGALAPARTCHRDSPGFRHHRKEGRADPEGEGPGCPTSGRVGTTAYYSSFREFAFPQLLPADRSVLRLERLVISQWQMTVLWRQHCIYIYIYFIIYKYYI